MKKMYLITFVLLIVFNIPATAQSSDYNCASSMNYFYDYLIDCRNQSKILKTKMEKYVDDRDRYDLFLDLNYRLETSVLRVTDLFDIYYLYDRLRSCATDEEKKFMKMRGNQFLDLYRKKELLEINKSILHNLQKKKFNDEYENWSKYINRLSDLCTFVENSINFNFK